MLYINGTGYGRYLADLFASQVVRGEETVETLAGTIYSYGTGKGYEATVTLPLVPTSVMEKSWAASPVRERPSMRPSRGAVRKRTADCARRPTSRAIFKIWRMMGTGPSRSPS